MAPTVVIIGAGPAGLVAAASFAQRGCNVEVHDKRAGPPTDGLADAHSHSLVIMLNQKGLRAIASVGAEARGFGLAACLRHSPDGRRAFAMIEPQPGAVVAFERSELTRQLYENVRRQWPAAVKFTFNSACNGLDLDRREVHVGPATAGPAPASAEAGPAGPADAARAPGTKAVRYDLLVAADGAHSAVRTCLCELLPGDFQCSIREAPLVYKRFKQLPASAELNGKYGTSGAVLHFFPTALPQAAAAVPAADVAAATAIPQATADESSTEVRGMSHALSAGAFNSTCSSDGDVDDEEAQGAGADGDSEYNEPAAATADRPPASSLAALVKAGAGVAKAGVMRSSNGTAAQRRSSQNRVSFAGLPEAAAGAGTVLGAAAPAGPVQAAAGDSAAQAPAASAPRRKAPAPSWGYLTLMNREDGTLCGGLSIPTSDQHFLRGAQDYEACLRNVPLPGPTMAAMTQQLAAAPWTWAGSWVRCSRLHAPGVLLVGDAAHAVSPSMGQGCNAALEDITVLQRILDDALASSGVKAGAGGGSVAALGLSDLEGVPEAFTRLRLPDMQALVWLDENARAFRGQMGMFNQLFIMYCAHMYGRGSLHRLAPRLVAKPALQEVWESPVPYTTIVKQLKQDGATLTLVSAVALGACVAGVAAWAMGRR